jgi:Ca2+-binding RTX toxin-like protein
MDIQRSGNTIHIKADDKDNNITVERKAGKVEVNIDGDKQSFDGKQEIIIDAGAGNDNIKVSNLPEGKSCPPLITIIGGEGNDSIEEYGNNKVVDNKGINTIISDNNNSPALTREADINGAIADIETIQSRKSQQKPMLEVKDKEEILAILKSRKDDGTLPDLVNQLVKDNKLVRLYRDMGTLVNQGDAGGAMSGILMIFTAGISVGVEAGENRAFEMKELLKSANIDEKILKKLK